MRILRFLCAGGLGAAVNLGTLHALVSLFHIHYLAASVIAFSLAAVVGFVLQKYWTFGEKSHSQVPNQFLLYLCVLGMNIAINTGIVYILVEMLGLHYLVAQTVGAASVATTSYILYKRVIFLNT